MATVTQAVREVALLVELEPHSSWVFAPLREVATLNDRTQPKPKTSLREVAQLNDAYIQTSSTLVHEVAQLNDAASTSIKRAARLMREVAKLSSRSAGGIRGVLTVREVALISSAADPKATNALRDVAQLNDAASPRMTSRRTLREVARIRGRAPSPLRVTLREVAQLNDAASGRVRGSGGVTTGAALREVALLSSALNFTTKRAAVLREVARFKTSAAAGTGSGGTATSPVTQTGGQLRDVFYVADTPTPPSYGRAYTCSIVTWGMSTLSNFPFLTMAGKFAAGANLWRLDADNDYGTPISSHITTGIKDFGADRLKHLSAVYIAGSSEAPLTVTVTGDVNGTRQQYEYTLQLRNQATYRNNRALVGKGFRSRFAQLQISATDVKYRLLTATADVTATARRI